MPNPVTRTFTEGAGVSPASRYASAALIYYEGKLTFPIYRKKKTSFTSADQHYEITQEVEFRPDKVSYKFYGAPDFWWKIMEMNGMKDILEFRSGRNIVLPGSGLMF